MDCLQNFKALFCLKPGADDLEHSIGPVPAKAEQLKNASSEDHSATVQLDEGRGNSEHGPSKAEIVGGCVRTFLQILKESADAFAPLKAVAGGICAVIETIDVKNGNEDETARLLEYTGDLLRDTLNKWMPELIGSELKLAGEEFQAALNKQRLELEEASKLPAFFKFTQGHTDADKLKTARENIEINVREFDRNIQLFTARTVVQTKTDVYEMRTIEKLSCAQTAAFTARLEDRRVARGPCAPGTREGIIAGISKWIETGGQSGIPETETIFWLTGPAGTGKTTIAYSICQNLVQNSQSPLVTYFCSRQQDSGQGRHLIPTLCRELATRRPSFRQHLADAIKNDLTCLTDKLVPQMRKLLLAPWSQCVENEERSIVVVIDALDENEDGYVFLDNLVTAVSKGALVGIKFFITSRVEPEIAERCKHLPSTRLQDVPVHEVNQDIRVYLKSSLEVSDALISRVVDKSHGLFIYAATVVRVITQDSKTRSSQQSALGEFLAAPKVVFADLADSDVPHYALYAQIIDSWLNVPARLTLRALRRRILHAVVSTKSPVTLPVITALVEEKNGSSVDTGQVDSAIQELHAVLFVDILDSCIYWYHASFQDFLVVPPGDTLDGKQPPYACHLVEQNAILANSCFKIMQRNLHFNMCNLESSFFLDKDVEDLETRVNSSISAPLRYACRFWGEHSVSGLQTLSTSDSTRQQAICGDIELFLNEWLLFWIETMNLLKETPHCTISLKLVRSAVEQIVTTLDGYENLPYDLLVAEDVAATIAGSPASKATPHLYLSILPSLSTASTLLKTWAKRFRDLPTLRSSASVPLLRIDAGDGVWAVVFSPDGKRIASGCHHGNLQVWDAITGQNIYEWEGNGATICAASFSPDGIRLASGSADYTVCIWNMLSGELEHILEGHSSYVDAAAFSRDGTRLVTGSHDGHVILWDTHLGRLERTFTGHTDKVVAVDFTPDGGNVMSFSADNTVRIWNLHSDEPSCSKPTKIGWSGWHVYCAVFFPDTAQIATGGFTLTLWDTSSGNYQAVFECESQHCFSVNISSDGQHLLSGYVDGTIRIWNVDTGEEERRFKADSQTGAMSSGTFSPDGSRIACASMEGTVKVWNIQTASREVEPKGHNFSVTCVAFSPDGGRVASGSTDGTIGVWNARTGDQQLHLKGEAAVPIELVVFSPSGKHLASSGDSSSSSVSVWDADTGVLKHIVRGPGKVHGLTFSFYETVFAASELYSTAAVWSLRTAASVPKDIDQVPYTVLQGHPGWEYQNSVAFSADGRHVVSGSKDNTVRVWDTQNGIREGLFDGHAHPVNSVCFSPDGARIASTSPHSTAGNPSTIAVWHAKTCARELEIQVASRVYAIAFSGDSEFLAAACGDDRIRIWNAREGGVIYEIPHCLEPTCVAFSPLSMHVVAGSLRDRAVRIWDCDTIQLPWSSPVLGGYIGELELDTDGWLVSRKGHRVLHVGQSICSLLKSPYCRLVISPQEHAVLDYHTTHIGKEWSYCYVGQGHK